MKLSSLETVSARRLLDRLARDRESQSVGLAEPCADWRAEKTHPAHGWGRGRKRYACPGYRPLDDSVTPAWDFNWPQPPRGCGAPDGPRWVA
jgi:hypothetical protein